MTKIIWQIFKLVQNVIWQDILPRFAKCHGINKRRITLKSRVVIESLTAWRKKSKGSVR